MIYWNKILVTFDFDLLQLSYKKSDKSDYEWLRVTTSDYKWLQVTTSDHESDYKWLRVTTSENRRPVNASKSPSEWKAGWAEGHLKHSRTSVMEFLLLVVWLVFTHSLL